MQEFPERAGNAMKTRKSRFGGLMQVLSSMPSSLVGTRRPIGHYIASNDNDLRAGMRPHS